MYKVKGASSAENHELLNHSVLSGNKKIYLFGSYLNLDAVVQHENCSAHLVT